MLLALKPIRTRSAAMSRRALSKTCDGAPECECQSPATTIAAQSDRPAATATPGHARNHSNRTTSLFMNAPTSAREGCHQFNMLRPQKLVHRRNRPHVVAAIDQDAGVARKTLGVAGNVGNPFHFGFGELQDLRFRAGTGWIKCNGVEFAEFAHIERDLEEIALGRRDRS